MVVVHGDFHLLGFQSVKNHQKNKQIQGVTYPPPEIRPYDQGLLSIGFP